MPDKKKPAAAKYPKVRNKFDRERLSISFPAESRTKQSFRDECNINKIMAKYKSTGAIPHLNNRTPQYGLASGNDFAESMRIVKDAQEMFDALPSAIRAKFMNQPEYFLNFVQDPENQDEMIELGLATRAQAPDPIEVTISPKDESPSEEPPPGDEAHS